MLQGLIAAGLGGATGTVLALAMGHFWLVGALLGGLVGSLSYYVPETVAAIPGAWHTAGARMRDWAIPGPNVRLIAREYFWVSLGTFALTQTLAGLVILFVVMVDPTVDRRVALYIWLLAPPLFGLVAGALLVSVSTKREQDIAFGRDLAKHTNLVSAVYWTSFAAAAILVFFLGVAAEMLRFVPELLRAIYSNQRLIAGVSALQGAIIGWAFSSWVIGGTASALLFAFQVKFVYERRYARAR